MTTRAKTTDTPDTDTAGDGDTPAGPVFLTPDEKHERFLQTHAQLQHESVIVGDSKTPNTINRSAQQE